MFPRHLIQAVPNGPSSDVGRFSDGLARLPRSTEGGSFANGLARWPDGPVRARVGSFADGLACRPNPADARRVGHFADGRDEEGRIAA